MATLQIGAPVEAADGPIGHLDALVLDPVSHSVEQLVIELEPRGGREHHRDRPPAGREATATTRRLVPASHLVEAGTGLVRLDLRAEQLLDCEGFDRNRYREVSPGELVLRTAELSDASDPVPEEPRDAGVPAPELSIAKVEPARLLGNEARDRLRAAGFTDREINGWSRAYFAVHDEGDADDLIAWIEEQERLDAAAEAAASANRDPHRSPGDR